MAATRSSARSTSAGLASLACDLRTRELLICSQDETPNPAVQLSARERRHVADGIRGTLSVAATLPLSSTLAEVDTALAENDW
jgi:hypothetical protein